jgi:hypothetical protein
MVGISNRYACGGLDYKIKIKMARLPNPDSVPSKCGALEVDKTIEFTNPVTSVAVMISHLKKTQEHKDKIFKIKHQNGITYVTRVR